jgi:hypothetical protein
MDTIHTLINYKKIFHLRDPLATRPLRLSISGFSDWMNDEQAWAIFKASEKPNQPIKLGAYQGGQATDFLWSAMPPLVCVSSRVVNLLEKNSITGWTTYPVEVFGRNGEELPGYHGFSITGPECRRDRSRSEIITKPPPVPTGKSFQVYKGLYFDEADWDGSDFFLVRMNIKVITGRVKDLFVQSKISNVNLIPLSEVERQVLLDRYKKNE